MLNRLLSAIVFSVLSLLPVVGAYAATPPLAAGTEAKGIEGVQSWRDDTTGFWWPQSSDHPAPVSCTNCSGGGGGGGSAANVGSSGSTAPSYSGLGGGIDPFGNLQPVQVDASKNLKTTNVIIGAAYGASGVASVSSSFTATGQSASFTPAAGRSFNVAVWSTTTPGATLNGTVYLARSTDGTNYLPVTANGTQIESFTGTVSEIWREDQAGVTYRLICSSYTSGTINYVVSQ